MGNPQNPAWTRDELILALELYFRHGRKQLDNNHLDVIELSQVLNRLTIYALEKRSATFRNPTGVSMKLGNFVYIDPDNPSRGLPDVSRLDKLVWGEFHGNVVLVQQLARTIRAAGAHNGGVNTNDIAEDEEFKEGRVYTALHRRQERNSRLVKRKKEGVLQKFGVLKCEVCDFDFATAYGKELGEGFAECHHTLPLSQLTEQTTTRLTDLAIVCANCHRMIHRGGKVRTIEELRTIVEANRG